MFKEVFTFVAVITFGSFALGQTVAITGHKVVNTTVEVNGSFDSKDVLVIKVAVKSLVGNGGPKEVAAIYSPITKTWSCSLKSLLPGKYKMQAVLNTGTVNVFSKEVDFEISAQQIEINSDPIEFLPPIEEVP